MDTLVDCEFPPAIPFGPVPDAGTTSYTVVMFGVARGGTTMIAGVAQRCGLFIGKHLPPNLEDPIFREASVDKMKRVIRRRNRKYDAWGWKFPNAARYLEDIWEELRNPRLVVVWRDIAATAARHLKKSPDWQSALLAAHQAQERNLSLIERVNCPVLAVSYERAVRAPLEFAAEFARFISLEVPADGDELVRFMAPGSYKHDYPLAPAGLVPSAQ